MLTNSNSELSDFGEYIKKATVILRESLIESFQEYIADIAEINKTISVDNMSEAITGAIDDVSQKSDEAV
jgi:lipoate-protein ligase A